MKTINTIPTAKEFLRSEYERLGIKWKDGDLKSWRDEDVEILIGFAKLHVDAASENYAQGSLSPGKGKSIKEAILTAYPLTNIK